MCVGRERPTDRGSVEMLSVRPSDPCPRESFLEERDEGRRTVPRPTSTLSSSEEGGSKVNSVKQRCSQERK